MRFERDPKLLDKHVEEALTSTEIQEGIENADVTAASVRSVLEDRTEEVWSAASREIAEYDACSLRFQDAEEKLEQATGMAPRKPASIADVFRRLAGLAIGLVIVVSIVLSSVLAEETRAALWAWVMSPIGLSVVLSGTGVCAAFGVWKRVRSNRRWLSSVHKRAAWATKLGRDDLEDKTKAAGTAVVAAVREKGILPLVREIINTASVPSYETVLPPIKAPGLSEVHKPEHEISTKAKVKLERLLDTMPGGTLGIAGERGAGKTTLMSACCSRSSWGDQDRKVLAVMTPAPVDYDTRDFILHLFAKVCQKFLRLNNIDTDDLVDTASPSRARRALLSAAPVIAVIWKIAAVLGSLVLLGGILLGAANLEPTGTGSAPAQGSQKTPSSQESADAAVDEADKIGEDESSVGTDELLKADPTDSSGSSRSVFFNRLRLVGGAFGLKPVPMILWGSQLIVVMFIMFYLARFARTASFVEVHAAFAHEDPKVRNAAKWLLRIKFQQSYTSGWSGSLKFPVGLETGAHESTTTSRRTFSLPEIVGAYNEFLREASMDYMVIIGIDEIDKMQSDKAAQRFLNDIKMIFGIPGCFYLISVSVSALSAFERRGLPLRDVFDSSIDDIVKVDYLDFANSQLLLRRRVIGIPVPFLCLCHCMSGGLARDLVRACRSLFGAAESNREDRSLCGLARRLITTDIDSKLNALIATTENLGLSRDGRAFSNALHFVKEHEYSPGQLVSHYKKFWPPDPTGTSGRDEEAQHTQSLESLRRMRAELASYLYFCATLLEFFDETLAETKLRDAVASGELDRLAGARQWIGGNPSLARETITSFRSLG